MSLGLIRSRRDWIYTALVGSNLDLVEALKAEADSRNILIRGCDPVHRSVLGEQGWYSRQSGIEAFLMLDGPAPWQPHRSLRELRRRALRKGKVEILDQLSQEDITFLNENLADLRNRSHYRLRPSLKHLYQNHADFWEQALLYRKEGTIQAIVGWSRNGPRARHLEVLLRAGSAPVGTMEALILESVSLARNQGIQVLSLGEVPFLRLSRHFKFPVYDTTSSAANGYPILNGDSLSYFEKPRKFASYYLMRPAFSSMGLFRFKNKFRPSWTPLYLMSNRRIGVLALADLFLGSGCHRLLGYCLTHPRHSKA